MSDHERRRQCHARKTNKILSLNQFLNSKEAKTVSDDLIEKMCREMWNAQPANQVYRWDTHTMHEPAEAEDFRKMIRLGLAILSKPENITPEMVNALNNNLDWMRCAEYGDMRSAPKALSAAISSLLNEATEKG